MFSQSHNTQHSSRIITHIADTINNTNVIVLLICVSIYMLPTLSQNSIAVHVRLFLEELREPVCRALGVPLQPVVVVHEVYPEPDSVAVHPLEVVKERPCEVALHVGAVPAMSCIASQMQLL